MTNKIRTAAIYFIVIIIFALGFVWISAMTRFGEFSTITPRFDGSCETKLGQIAGVEDISIFNSKNQNLIALSSFDRIKAKKNKDEEGGIYLFDVNNLNSEPLETIKSPNGFAPIGIDFVSGAKTRIGAINGKNGSKIEIFEQNDAKFSHIQTVEIKNASRLNDLAFFDENSFYVSNEGENDRDGVKNFILNFLDMDKSGSIYFYDGKSAKKVATGLSYANSIVISKDKKHLLASATLGRELRIYSINPDKTLMLENSIFVGTGIDNLSIDDEGRIFAAAHPRLFTLMKKFWFNSPNPYSQAIVIEPNADFKTGKIDQVYLAKDTEKMGSVSAAVKYQNKLFMGSIFDNGLMVCSLPSEWHQSKTHPANRLIDTSRDYQIKKAKKDLKIDQ